MTRFVSEHEDDRRLSKEELGICTLLAFAGHERSANLIGNGLLALLKHREEFQRLRSDALLIASAGEEPLRFDSPVQLVNRIVRREPAPDRHRMAEGDRLAVLMAPPTATQAASRIPACSIWRVRTPARNELAPDRGATARTRVL